MTKETLKEKPFSGNPHVRAALAFALCLTACAAQARLHLAPYPQKAEETAGVWKLATNRVTRADVVWKTDAAIAKEGYRLVVTPEGATAWSSDAAGAFYALKTLEQLARPQAEATVFRPRFRPLEIPCCRIEDFPRFGYRGFMIDDARHFMGKEIVKKYVDLASAVKMNAIHLHLTDDEGWRLESKRHPELHLKGSVRPQQMVHGATEEFPAWDNAQYGPYYYTHDDIREILAYAAERHVEIIPEFDFPAHARALFAAHPEFTCLGPDPRFAHPITYIGPQYECFCAANEEGMKFIEDVLDEICELFPSKLIHIGGDECPPDRWQACPKCRALMAKMGLDPKDAGALQSHMTVRFSKFLADRGRKAYSWRNSLRWNYPLPKALPKNLVLELAHDPVDRFTRTDAGLDVIKAPKDSFYLQRPQNIPNDPIQYLAEERYAISLETAFRFNPTEGMTPAQRAHVLGVECCSWSEMTWGWYDMHWKMWPRMFAAAEVGWTGPACTDFEDFLARIVPLRDRLVADYVNAAPITVHPDPRLVAAPGTTAGRSVAFVMPRGGFASDPFAVAAFRATLEPPYDAKVSLEKAPQGTGGRYNSPFGAFVDELTPSSSLAPYRAAFLVGTQAAGVFAPQALETYVREGGTLFVSADQVMSGAVAPTLSGVSFDGREDPCDEVVLNEQGYRIFQIAGGDGIVNAPTDGNYNLLAGRPSEAKPFLTDALGHVACWKRMLGKGCVYTVTCRGMIASEYASASDPDGRRMKLVASGHRVFPFVRYLLTRVQNDLSPVTVNGDVRWELRPSEKGWTLRLANRNVPELGVSRVTVNLKDLKGRAVRSSDSVVATPDGLLTAFVAPGSEQVFEIVR